MAYWTVFEEHFLHYDTLIRHREWTMSIDRHQSTMQQRLRVGIRDLCSLSI